MKSLLIYIILIMIILLPFSTKAFSVSPGLVELSANRGETIESTLILINTAPEEKTIYLSKQKFTANEVNGSPKFIPYNQDHSGLVDWMLLPADKITVPAQSKIDIPISVVVPNDIISGGYYGSVIFSEAPYDLVASNGASIQAKTAILFLVTVKGENQEKLALLDLTSSQSGKIQSEVFGDFNLRLQNQGNVHLSPKGNLILKDIFGRIITVANINPNNGNILPNSTRTFKGNFGKKIEGGLIEKIKYQWKYLAFGPINAFLDLNYGTKHQNIQADFQFWIFPWQLLILIILILIILSLVLKGVKKTLQKK